PQLVSTRNPGAGAVPEPCPLPRLPGGRRPPAAHRPGGAPAWRQHPGAGVVARQFRRLDRRPTIDEGDVRARGALAVLLAGRVVLRCWGEHTVQQVAHVVGVGCGTGSVGRRAVPGGEGPVRGRLVEFGTRGSGQGVIEYRGRAVGLRAVRTGGCVLTHRAPPVSCTFPSVPARLARASTERGKCSLHCA